MLKLLIKLISLTDTFLNSIQKLLYKKFIPNFIKKLIKKIQVNNFRISSKTVYLTYSQIGDVTLDELYMRLNNVSSIDSIIACIEYHIQPERRSKQKGRHFHVLVKFNAKIDTVNANIFDIPVGDN